MKHPYHPKICEVKTVFKADFPRHSKDTVEKASFVEKWQIENMIFPLEYGDK